MAALDTCNVNVVYCTVYTAVKYVVSAPRQYMKHVIFHFRGFISGIKLCIVQLSWVIVRTVQLNRL